MEIIDVISSVGFPIAMCLVLLWYINKKDEQYITQLAKIEQEVDETRAQTTEALTKVKTALVNNTIVIERNTDLLKSFMAKLEGKE